MNKKDYEALRQALQKQRKEVTSSKKAAKKFLKDAGVLHLLVPKETNNARHLHRIQRTADKLTATVSQ